MPRGRKGGRVEGRCVLITVEVVAGVGLREALRLGLQHTPREGIDLLGPGVEDVGESPREDSLKDGNKRRCTLMRTRQEPSPATRSQQSESWLLLRCVVPQCTSMAVILSPVFTRSLRVDRTGRPAPTAACRNANGRPVITEPPSVQRYCCSKHTRSAMGSCDNQGRMDTRCRRSEQRLKGLSTS